MISHKLTISLFLGLVLAAVPRAASVEVEPALLEKLDNKGSVNVVLSFKKGDTSEITSEISILNFETKQERRKAVYDRLNRHAETTQKSVLDFLGTQNRVQSGDIKRFWITNSVLIKNADRELLNKLMEREDISEIIEEPRYELEKSVPFDLSNVTDGKAAGVRAGEEWGVIAIEAPEVWNMGYRGQGVVVSHLDSGVRGTHEALRDNFRQQYGWLDPITNTASPVDDQGHGTHTMGTIVGKGGIGVAPDAQWISCKACGADGFCEYGPITTCAEWVICPDERDCSFGADLVSNSWGGSGESAVYENMVAAWVAADVTPIFSAGNNGPRCYMVGTPGTNPDVIGVASISQLPSGELQVSTFSSRGPSILYEGMKPDVAAPGSIIRSASYDSDTGYSQKQGTSMAAPHVAGLVALLKNKRPSLTVEEMKIVILTGATHNLKPTEETCRGASDLSYPNYHVGYGMINARNSILATDRPIDPIPTPTEKVPSTTDSSAEAITAVLKQKPIIILAFLTFYAMKSLVF